MPFNSYCKVIIWVNLLTLLNIFSLNSFIACFCCIYIHGIDEVTCNICLFGGFMHIFFKKIQGAGIRK